MPNDSNSQDALRSTVLPGFRRIETPPDAMVIMLEFSQRLTPSQALPLTPWSESEVIAPCCGGPHDDATARVFYRLDLDECQATWGRFWALAEEAGQMLGDWATAAGVTQCTLTKHHGAARWLSVLVDMALAGELPITVKRFYLAPTAVRADSLRMIAGFHPDATAEDLEDEITEAQSLGFFCELSDVVRCSIWAIERLTSMTGTPSNDPSDGPSPDYRFSWQGETCDLGPILWKLLSCMWGSEAKCISDVEQDTWGDELPPEKIGPTIWRINQALQKVGYSKQLERRGDVIRWGNRPTS